MELVTCSAVVHCTRLVFKYLEHWMGTQGRAVQRPGPRLSKTNVRLSVCCVVTSLDVPLLSVVFDTSSSGPASITWMRQIFHNSVPTKSSFDRSEVDSLAVSGTRSICSSMARMSSSIETAEALVDFSVCRWHFVTTNAAARSVKASTLEDAMMDGQPV